MSREQVGRKIEKKLQEWDKTADDLKSMLASEAADVQAKYHEDIEATRKKHAGLREKLVELRDSGDDAWEDLKVAVDDARQDIESAWVDIKKGVENAASRFARDDDKNSPTV